MKGPPTKMTANPKWLTYKDGGGGNLRQEVKIYGDLWQRANMANMASHTHTHISDRLIRQTQLEMCFKGQPGNLGPIDAGSPA